VIVRYPRELRSDPQAIATHILVPTTAEAGQVLKTPRGVLKLR